MSGPIVIMGVAGCGKSSLAVALSKKLGWHLIEGDDFHPPENVQKMRSGVALNDEDRAGWLAVLADQLVRYGSQTVLTCSALKKAYRDRLRLSGPALRFVHLDLTLEQSLARVAQRSDHYFQPSLVDSQFQALEKPVSEAGVLTLDGMQSIDGLLAHVCAWIERSK